MPLLPTEKPLTVAQLRAILDTAPDDAAVLVNFHRSLDGEPLTLAAFAGEYLPPEQWGEAAGLLIQATY